MNRRDFLMGGVAAVAASAAPAVAAKPPDIPIIDTHVHLFDPRRPQGVPYAGPRGQPPQLALPANYRRLAIPAGVVGAVVVEASPWVEDNLWILERAASDPLFVGVIGSLAPHHPEFAEYLNRFAKDPLWRGIRYSAVWTVESGKQVLKPGIVDGLKLLAKGDMVLDMANPSFDLLRAALLVTEAVPELRVVMDHMPSLDPTPDTQAQYDQLIGELGLQRADRFPLVHRAAVPDDHESAGQVPQHRLDEGGHIPTVEVAVGQRVEVEPQVVPAGRQPHRRRDRDLLAVGAALGDRRGLALRRPSAAQQRSHQQAALVDQGEVRPLSSGFFLMRGQSDSSHAAIAFGSRSRGTRCGFCGLNPRSRNHTLRYLGWSRMANSSRISWANREAVHNSVSNPCSIGLSANHRRTIFSWVRVNLGGRPGTGRESRLCPPPSRCAATQRRTDRGSTPRNSATSSTEYPSKTRWTASKRRCSCSSGEPLSLIPVSLRERNAGGHYFPDSQ